MTMLTRASQVTKSFVQGGSKLSQANPNQRFRLGSVGFGLVKQPNQTV